MEFGLHLPNAGPFANGPDILRVARAAEELGYHSVWLFDHLFTPKNLESKYPYMPDGSYPMLPEFPFYDPVSVMAALAGATERIKFGTRVLIPTYRHPVVLAKELATTDAIAGGRMILGVGAGWMAEEFDAVDVPISNLTSRVRQDVLNRTDRRQRSWDHSSLMEPFYFNPGNLLLFTGNGGVLSVIG